MRATLELPKFIFLSVNQQLTPKMQTPLSLGDLKVRTTKDFDCNLNLSFSISTHTVQRN